MVDTDGLKLGAGSSANRKTAHVSEGQSLALATHEVNPLTALGDGDPPSRVFLRSDPLRGQAFDKCRIGNDAVVISRDARLAHISIPSLNVPAIVIAVLEFEGALADDARRRQKQTSPNSMGCLEGCW